MRFDNVGFAVATVAEKELYVTCNPVIDQTFLKTVIKEYPDMFKIVIYRSPKVILQNKMASRRRAKNVVNFTASYFSLRRSRQTVKDLVLCNSFEWFVTFTIDPTKNNRYDIRHCCHVMRVWLGRQHDKDPDFKYLVIPELHKDGAVHFHGLLSHFNGSMRDSNHRTHTGQPIYNITCFRSGFTTAIPVSSSAGLATYITKYISKSFVSEFNKQRYYCSRNLVRPVKTVNGSVKNIPPLFLYQDVKDFPDFQICSVPKTGLFGEVDR